MVLMVMVLMVLMVWEGWLEQVEEVEEDGGRLRAKGRGSGLSALCVSVRRLQARKFASFHCVDTR
jgi:hypothetical protein